MTTVVTGASGTVGRSLVAQLARAGEPVRAVTRNPATGGPSIRAERVVRWPFPDEVGIPIHEADIAGPTT
jgi:uncharacterized protein YbjT (DUF2867 family)